ncbi:MAG: hypothetical protein KGL39_12570 [Patescibacteria group bacterium]|nr:hypothetical protein [Patescibacteria group bacterium]
MSANLIVDLGNTAIFQPSLISGNGVSGQVCGMSGVYVGQSVDFLHANTMCNVYITGNPALSSGNLIIGVQCSDSDTSGNYTDPTSGVAQLPSVFLSGGNVWINSGSTGGIYQSGGYSGSFFQSGFIAFASFQRTQRFARLLFNSGFYIGPLTAGFISQAKTTGSGGGFSFSPGSGSVSV